MNNFVVPTLLSVGAGVSILIQQVLNANLRPELNSAIWSGFLSYVFGVAFKLRLAARFVSLFLVWA